MTDFRTVHFQLRRGSDFSSAFLIAARSSGSGEQALEATTALPCVIGMLAKSAMPKAKTFKDIGQRATGSKHVAWGCFTILDFLTAHP
jgi:hypothetical protein